jgi:hypothetical protein
MIDTKSWTFKTELESEGATVHDETGDNVRIEDE